jgi:hypothetical protein
MADIEGDASTDFSFEGGFAAEDPEGKLQRGEGAAAYQQEQRIQERVAFDEGTVQVNAEGPAGDVRSQLLKGRLVQGDLSHGFAYKPSEQNHNGRLRLVNAIGSMDSAQV